MLVDMKQRSHSSPARRYQPVHLDALADAIVHLGNAGSVRRFLHDLCTPAELEALVDRWRVVQFILNGMSYRQIHEQTGVSVTTIGRVARTIGQGTGGYREALGADGQAKQPSQEVFS